MVSPRDELFEQALRLPPEDRRHLADRLAASCPPPTQEQIDAEWRDEVQRRVNAYRRGEVEVIDAAEVFRAIEGEPDL